MRNASSAQGCIVETMSNRCFKLTVREIMREIQEFPLAEQVDDQWSGKSPFAERRRSNKSNISRRIAREVGPCFLQDCTILRCIRLGPRPPSVCPVVLSRVPNYLKYFCIWTIPCRFKDTNRAISEGSDIDPECAWDPWRMLLASFRRAI